MANRNIFCRILFGSWVEFNISACSKSKLHPNHRKSNSKVSSTNVQVLLEDIHLGGRTTIKKLRNNAKFIENIGRCCVKYK